MSQLRYTRIQGVNFPQGTPRDFADQIQGLLKKYNQIVDDMLVYHETIIELRKSNELLKSHNQSLRTQNDSLKSKNESLQDENEELKYSYDALKDVSEKVASKYEMECSKRSSMKCPVSGKTINSLSAKLPKENIRKPQNGSPKNIPDRIESDDSDEETVLELPAS